MLKKHANQIVILYPSIWPIRKFYNQGKMMKDKTIPTHDPIEKKSTAKEEILKISKSDLDALIAQGVKEAIAAEKTLQLENYNDAQIDRYGYLSGLTDRDFIVQLLKYGITADQASVLRNEHKELTRERIWERVRQYWIEGKNKNL